jgi:probable addiction module antidote protein
MLGEDVEGMIMGLETKVFDIAEHLNSEDDISEFLTVAFESGDPGHIAQGLGIVARAKNIAELSRQTGLSRAALYRAFNGDTNPEFASIMKILDALGVTLSAKIITKSSDAANHAAA